MQRLGALDSKANPVSSEPSGSDDGSGRSSNSCRAARIADAVLRMAPAAKIAMPALLVAAFGFSNAAMAQYNQPAVQPPAPPPDQQAVPNAALKPTITDNGPRAELYTGLDVASHGWFYQWLEGTQAPFGSTDSSGFRVRLFGEAGQFHYPLDNGKTERETMFEGDFLIGYAFEQEHLEAEIYVGTAIIQGLLAIPDPENPVQGSAFGPKVVGEFKWTDQGALVAGEASYTTAFKSYSAKVQLGLEVFSKVYIGPEFIVMGDEMFNQWRVGGHATIMRFDNLRFGLGAGYAVDSDNGPGLYGSLRAGIAF
jgi:hypothetical protein